VELALGIYATLCKTPAKERRPSGYKKTPKGLETLHLLYNLSYFTDSKDRIGRSFFKNASLLVS
jgi:hypothetical protein